VSVARAALLAVLALALAPPGAAASPSAAPAPSLRFLDLTPALVRGARFAPGERVRVTLRAGTDRRVRTIRAAARGGFTVNFGRLREQDRCSGLVSIAAVGARGDRAFYRLPAMACPAMASGPFR
jgi:hypothetical protein